MTSNIAFIERPGYWLVVNRSRPDWAAMNDAGADLLRGLMAGVSEAELAAGLGAPRGLPAELGQRVVSGFAAETEGFWRPGQEPPYEGRAAYLRLGRLRELWLHVNDRCNLACRHCLFSSGASGGDGLPSADLLRILGEARELGARTFFFTGGEPVLRGDLPELLAAALADEDTHAVVLTNGSLIDDGFLAAVAGLDPARLHLQVSLDASTPALNDRLRSPGAFEGATAGLRRALAAGLDATVATVVLAANLDDLPDLADLVAEMGVGRLHLIWAHLRERGAEQELPDFGDLPARIVGLKAHCDLAGVLLDNAEHFRGVIEGEPGIKRDGTGACWDSLALYIDGCVYPSAALVGLQEFRGDSAVERGLERAWRESGAFERYRRRQATALCPDDDPLYFFHGGGDPEHAHFHGRARGGPALDPYLSVYRALLLACADDAVAWRQALMPEPAGLPLVYATMGQDGLGCPVKSGAESDGPHRLEFAPSNCVLIEDVVGHARRLVQEYYGEAAVEPKTEVCSPVAVDRRYLTHIPQEVLERSYGCGSPVFAAGIGEGDVVVDLGSGAGIEVFVASRRVGERGLVIGVDMTPEMLDVARRAQEQVAANLGYDNVEFLRGYLEALPLASGSADVVLSNCVINLSPQKLRVFAEIRRVLRPGGRMVISDIVAAEALPEDAKFNPRLRGECIAGALTRQELLLMLSKLGFEGITVERETPWRKVAGVQFYSTTLSAGRPREGAAPVPYAVSLATTLAEERHQEGCVVCGEPLVYSEAAVEAECHFCGRRLRTRALCAAGHYVCDRCHGGDYMRYVRSFVAQCDLTDPVAIFLAMREGYPFPVHGPEHHALVPAAFLVAYRNLGGDVSSEAVDAAVRQGADLPGGSCAYWGACAAALGMGIAYSTILGATPLEGDGRSVAQELVSRILSRIAGLGAARCCQRESLLALLEGAAASAEFLPVAVVADGRVLCQQVWLNGACLGEACAFLGRGSKGEGVGLAGQGPVRRLLPSESVSGE